MIGADFDPSRSPTMRLIKSIISHFLRQNIAWKMFLGYIPLFLLLVIISTLSFTSLTRLNALNNSILETDLPVNTNAEKLIDSIISQETYLRRYVLLNSPEMLVLYKSEIENSNQLLHSIKDLPGGEQYPIDEISREHKEYTGLLIKGMEYWKRTGPRKETYETTLREHQKHLITAVKALADKALANRNRKTELTSTMGSSALEAAAVFCIVGLVVSIAAAGIVTRNISGAIRKLKYATEKVAEGQFDHDLNINNKDELGDLAKSFMQMGRRLRTLEEMYIDASPLTRLPGGVAIENVLKKKIKAEAPLAFCIMDIDNFKAYNDHYGYSKGNELIRSTAGIIERAAREINADDCFLGHIGGDDFVLITTPDKYRPICKKILKDFDAGIRAFYNSTDCLQGYITGVNRQGDKVHFPLATLSIAVVTNEKRTFRNHIQVGEVAADLKEYAKTFIGNNMVVDQRQDHPPSKKVVKMQKIVEG